MLKAGFITYLNAYPFYYPFELMGDNHPGWDFTVDRPGILNKMIRDGELDISLISFMEYASRPHLYQIIRGIGLSSKGYVDSVRLISKVPLEELNGSSIRITSASATSVAVMEIILKESGVSEYECAVYDVKQGIPDCTAALTIGDEALLADTSDFPYSYDLGEIWQRLFDHNIVFAVCAVRNEAADWKLTEVSSFVQQLLKAPQYCLNHLNEFEEACQKRYPEIKNHLQYLKRLHYQMQEHEEADLHFFLKKAEEHGLIENEVIPAYFIPPLELAGN